MSDPWKLFAREASRTRGGQRLLVPVLGAGFNAQAGRGKGWADLLAAIKRERSLKLEIPAAAEVIGNTTLVWEAMLLELSPDLGKQPQLVEKQLQGIVADVLDRTYTVGGITKNLAARFLSARFGDIVSLNFDRGLHLVEPSWVKTNSQKFDPVRSFAELSDGTRVWYPHGVTHSPNSIQLGMRKYGILIQQLEEARQEYKGTANAIKAQMFPGSGRKLSKREAERLWWAHRNRAQSWVSGAINAPLVFIGVGMGREEWPLWWFLNQRARNHARRNLRTPAFVFVHQNEVSRLKTAAELARLTLLVFDDFGAGWKRLFKALNI